MKQENKLKIEDVNVGDVFRFHFYQQPYQDHDPPLGKFNVWVNFVVLKKGLDRPGGLKGEYIKLYIAGDVDVYPPTIRVYALTRRFESICTKKNRIYNAYRDRWHMGGEL